MDTCSSNPCCLRVNYMYIHTYTYTYPYKYIHMVQKYHHASQGMTFFLQPGFMQVRSNLDFQNRCWKLEANKANVALRNMLSDSHIFKSRNFLIQNQDFWVLRKKNQGMWQYRAHTPACLPGAGLNASVPFRWGNLSSVHWRPPTS